MTFQRRHFLRGLGAAVALPSLEAFFPAGRALAAAPGAARAVTATGAPLRMGFVYFPNGVNLQHWRPEGVGSEFGFGRTLAPLEAHKDQLQVFTGFAHANAEPGRDGAGDHARALATFLTGVRAKKTAGADIELGVSVDQVAARQLEDLTRLSSLELSCDGVRKSGACDSGYSCAYQFNLSWRTPTTPMAPESNPRLVFERLFGTGPSGKRQENYRQRREQKRSILDFVMDDAQALNRRLGRNDQQKMDEYLTGVREIEKRVEKAEHFGDLPDPGVDSPEGVPGEYRDHIRLMFDLMALAWETDQTRVASFMMAHDGSNRSFPEIGVADGHHNISHHRNDPEKLENIAKIDHFYVQQFAGFLERLRSTKDADGRSILDNSMIVYGSGISDPDRHDHDDLPIVLAGGGGGTLTPGRHVKFDGDVPLSNLYLTMLHRMGVQADRFGDSTGVEKNV